MPYYDEFLKYNDGHIWGKLYEIIALVYFSIIIYFILLCMSIYNSWAFLIKQGKYKTLPLLLFYILAILLSVDRIAYSILFFGIYLDHGIVLLSMKAFFYFNVGLVQCWSILELALRVRESIKLTSIVAQSSVSKNSED